MKERSLTSELIGEVFGTFILILLGDGVVANVGLAPRVASAGYNWNTIVLGWCFAVIVAVYVSAGVSGAHINPAVTIALAVKRGFSWSKVVPYILAQMVGAFLGAAAVYLVYSDGLVAAGMPNVWCTGPGSVFGQAYFGAVGSSGGVPYSMLTATFAEFFGTAVLLWGVLASGDANNTGLMHNLGQCWSVSRCWRWACPWVAPAVTRSIQRVTLVRACLAWLLARRVCLMACTG